MGEHDYRPNWLSEFYRAVGKAANAVARDAAALTPAWQRVFGKTPVWFILLGVIFVPIWLWLL